MTIGVICGGLLIAVLLWAFPEISPDAPDQLAVALALKLGIGLFSVLFLSWALWFIDATTDGEWSKTIGGNPYASAAVYVAIIWGCVAIMRIV